MKTIIVSAILVPTMSWAAIYTPEPQIAFPSNITIQKPSVTDTLKKEKLQDKIKEHKKSLTTQHENINNKVLGEDYLLFNDLSKMIKQPKHTALTDELKKQYLNNYKTLKKCYIKPKDNLQDLMLIMGHFINAYADIVYGKEIISNKQSIQNYDLILSMTPLNPGVNPEECLKAREFFDNELL